MTLISEVPRAGYVVREMTLQYGDTKDLRKVRHIQFTAWPDHGMLCVVVDLPLNIRCPHIVK